MMADTKKLLGGSVVAASLVIGAVVAVPPVHGQVGSSAIVGGARLQSAVPSCALDRIDQQSLPLDDRYFYPRQAGEGVVVYLVDSGIDYDNPDIAPRARPGFDAFGGDGRDELGNGTSMAGIIGGTTYGVAKKVEMVSVKVINAQGGGSIEGLIAGIEWITEHASGPSVVNVVLGIPPDDRVDEAVRRSIASGITYVIEGGAVSEDVATASPARVEEAVTVGVSDCADRVMDTSNFGAGLDVYAPGVDVPAVGSDGTVRTHSGAHVAASVTSGVAALHLSRDRQASPEQVHARLREDALTGVLTGVPSGTASRLITTSGAHGVGSGSLDRR